jgi:hypothetical protein
VSHVEDLAQWIITLPKRETLAAVILIVDNGPDWSPRSLLNLYYYGEL